MSKRVSSISSIASSAYPEVSEFVDYMTFKKQNATGLARHSLEARILQMSSLKCQLASIVVLCREEMESKKKGKGKRK
jgi:hypothetical protein